ncbi:hypothetical protein C5167_043116 [Papaver somniferum]|uniref:SAM-dependent methyltransferase TRM5/TYW2-type domain-containing protein n=1 Tax=Papaver somniferum TaxID=3469 RepID=A0A4Y7L4R8_PAPSO|nr:hypothetical protein C5167_043116 [Papaver somniferum]
MATKLVLQSHPLPVFLFSANHFLRKQSPHNLSLFTSFSTVSSTQTLTLTHNIIYGPSLHKGTNPSQYSVQVIDEDEREVINKESFSRVFELSALRVPAEECFPLENRLRGHLLNWPRVCNIARVPGDEMEDEFKKILPEKNDTGEDEEEKKRLDSLDRRLYGKADDDGEELSPVLYRDNIMKSFNSRGYVNFRNVAKISRPKKNTNKRRNEGEGSDREKRIGKNDFAVVEVVGNENDDFSGLLGEDFKGGRWRGSTRLLLLDENLANKNVEELPEAIKILEALLPKGAIVPSAFETIGHIAHLNLRDEHLPYKKLIAQVVLDKNKPKIRTVVNKVESIQNEYRTMQLEVLARNNSLVATVTENGIRFHVDLAAV